MNEEVKLPEHIVKLLLELPESGMGYQIVDLIFSNGEVIKHITILNSSIAILDSSKKVIVDNIVNVRLSQ